MIPLKPLLVAISLIFLFLNRGILCGDTRKNVSMFEVTATPGPMEATTTATATTTKKSLFFSLLYSFPLPWEIIPRKQNADSKIDLKSENKEILPSSVLDDILNDIDEEYKNENGSISMNDTEIVIMSNGKSVFRIIDEEHQMIKVNVTILDLKATISPSTTTINSSTTTTTAMTSDINSTSTSFTTTPIYSSSTMTTKTSARPHRRLLPVTTPKCEHLTEKQKYAKLESVGGRNQQFMANTPEEAGKNFVNLLPDTENTAASEINDDMLADSANERRHIDPYFCDDRCEEIKLRLHDVFQEKYKKTFFNKPLNDSGPPEVQEGRPIKGHSGCYLEKFISIGNCTSRGEEEIWGYEKLCSACQGIYLMSDHCFPSFINAVTCDKSSSERECIFDRFTSSAHGKCQSKTLSFKVMRNKGTKECEEWVYEYIDVPIACECFLSKSSWLNSMPEN